MSPLSLLCHAWRRPAVDSASSWQGGGGVASTLPRLWGRTVCVCVSSGLDRGEEMWTQEEQIRSEDGNRKTQGVYLIAAWRAQLARIDRHRPRLRRFGREGRFT